MNDTQALQQVLEQIEASLRSVTPTMAASRDRLYDAMVAIRHAVYVARNRSSSITTYRVWRSIERVPTDSPNFLGPVTVKQGELLRSEDDYRPEDLDATMRVINSDGLILTNFPAWALRKED